MDNDIITEVELLTPKETAALLDMDPRSLYQLRKRRKLLRWAITPGGTHRYYADEVRALRRQRVQEGRQRD